MLPSIIRQREEEERMSTIGEISADKLVSDMINLMQRYAQEDAFAKAIHRVVIGLHRVSEKAVREAVRAVL